MNITKFGHSCLLVEEGSVRLLIDPGIFSDGFQEISPIDAILITHLHPDHCDPAALRGLIEQNPQTKVYSNDDVRALLEKEGMSVIVPKDREKIDVSGVSIRSYQNTHAEIYRTLPRPQCTGFLIADRFYYGGDNLDVPDAPVDILALPVVAPWGKTVDFIDFAVAIHPRIVFPVHDAIGIPGFFAKFPASILPEFGIEVKILEHRQVYDF